MKKNFTVWAFGDAHVGTDLKHGRKSLKVSIDQSEGRDPNAPGIPWDIAIDVGDMSGEQRLPTDNEGQEIVDQFKALKQHPREAVYNLCGNHDRSGLKEEPAHWWRKWVDPMGNHTEFSQVDPGKRPFPVEGTWERYSFRAGNILFLIMSDINEPSQKIGRGDLGGNPSGVVSQETFLWWKDMVESNPDSIIISAHHYVLKNTTVASGPWEGVQKDKNGNWRGKYHGYKEQGTPQGASYLHWVGSKEDSGAFEGVLESNPGAVDIWLGGHTHTNPEDTAGGKSHIETKWGTHFINAAALTDFHVGTLVVPKSRVLTFTPGSSEARVQCYLHTDDFAPRGWYTEAERVLTLSRPFEMP